MSTRASVTCPSCGSLVPVGDRKCDNCGARQKDFAPAPQSYTRPETMQAPPAPPAPAAPVRASAPAVPSPAPAPAPSATQAPVLPPHDYRPLAHRPAGAAPAAPSAAYAVPPSLPAPSSTPPAAPPSAPGSHAQGVAPRSAPYAAPGATGPSLYKLAADAAAPTRSRTASVALLLAVIAVGINLLVFILVFALLGAAEDVDIDDTGAFVGGIFTIGLAVIGGGIANIVLFLLALIFGIIGVRQTAAGLATGRWRAVLALVLVGWHVLLLIGFIALAVVATN